MHNNCFNRKKTSVPQKNQQKKKCSAKELAKKIIQQKNQQK